MQQPTIHVQQPTLQVQQPTLQVQQPTLQVQASTIQVFNLGCTLIGIRLVGQSYQIVQAFSAWLMCR